jgi:beta-galactosidase
VVKRTAALVKREGPGLLASAPDAQVCAGLYMPYFSTELTASQLLKDRRLHVDRLGLTLDPQFVREQLFFNGLLRGLQTLNLGYDVRDLETVALDALAQYKQLWVVSTEYMDAATQERLLAYVRRGGHLVMYPAVPTLDLYLRPCSVLADGLQIHPTRSRSPHKVKAFEIPELFTYLADKQIYVAEGGTDVVATTTKGEPCGIRKNVGKGSVTALGFAFGYTTDDHLALYRSILGLDRLRAPLDLGEPDVQYVIRRWNSAHYLFLLNYHDQKKTVTVGSRRHTLAPFSWKLFKRRNGRS